jgi:hypothetical protein
MKKRERENVHADCSVATHHHLLELIFHVYETNGYNRRIK